MGDGTTLEIAIHIIDSPLKSLKNEKRPKIALGNQRVIAVRKTQNHFLKWSHKKKFGISKR